jgi:hypothetical protein
VLEEAAALPGGGRVTWMRGAADEPPAGPFDLLLLLGNTLSLIEEPAGVFEAGAAVAAPGALFAVQILDYASLREAGASLAEREEAGVRVVKTLAPRSDADGGGANLEIEVFDPEGKRIGHTGETLRDHPEPALVDVAQAAGWTLTERRASFEEASTGSDRIYLLRYTKRNE